MYLYEQVLVPVWLNSKQFQVHHANTSKIYEFKVDGRLKNSGTLRLTFGVWAKILDPGKKFRFRWVKMLGSGKNIWIWSYRYKSLNRTVQKFRTAI